MSATVLWVTASIFSWQSSVLAGLLVGVGGLPVAALAAEMLARLVHRHATTAWQKSKDGVDWIRVHHRVVTEFRASVERSRISLLAPSSSLAAHRRQLQQGLHDARRSTEFWRKAVTEEPSSETNRAQLQTAEDLEGKLVSAVERLDQRNERVSAFLARCEEKARALEFSKRKLAETRRRASIADRTSNVIASTDDALGRLGQEFLTEAASAFGALGGLERLHMTEMAGDMSLDSIEVVAEQIVRSAGEEERVLLELARDLGGTDAG
jgi:hypothetical protein